MSLINATFEESHEADDEVSSEAIPPQQSPTQSVFSSEENSENPDLSSTSASSQHGDQNEVQQNQSVETAYSSQSPYSEGMHRHEMLKELETRLEKVLKEKEEIKITNERLEYWLTALETENETIGEYISIYRYQRNTIQKKLAEKDALIAQLQHDKILIQVCINLGD